MILLYVAVALVFAGVLLVLYSEFFEVSIKKTLPQDRFVPNFDDDFFASKHHKTTNTVISQMDEQNLDDLPDIDIDVTHEISTKPEKESVNKNKDQDKDKDSILQSQEARKGYNVILYVDSSGKIGAISDHLNSHDWSFLTRIGSGYLQYVQQGINITINNKLYRYDFYRIASMKAQDNYMLFTIKGKNTVNCIVLNEESDILLNIEKEYFSFTKS
ncbi:MAG: hypothetical protein WHV26_02695 [Spirochaetota bacterium]